MNHLVQAELALNHLRGLGPAETMTRHQAIDTAPIKLNFNRIFQTVLDGATG